MPRRRATSVWVRPRCSRHARMGVMSLLMTLLTTALGIVSVRCLDRLRYSAYGITAKAGLPFASFRIWMLIGAFISFLHMRDGDDDGCAALVDYKYHPMVADTEPVIVASLQAFDVTRTIRPVCELLCLGVDVLRRGTATRRLAGLSG